MTELLPCPFCGGEAKSSSYWHKFIIECDYCQEYGHGAYVVARTEAEAVAAWNTRRVETCRLPETRIDHGSIEYNGTTSWRLCSACEAEVLADPANYCPNCGAKVVSE